MLLDRTDRATVALADPRWAQLKQRDAYAEDSFFYAVETTGVYCRPSCAARLPRPEHVTFYESRDAAERAGYRPCLRCKPDQPPLAARHAELVAAMCRWIESEEAPPRLDQLAARAGLSVFHVQRLFKRVVGMSPKAYATAKQGERMREALQRSKSVTEAIYDAGFNSSARFYERADALLGMSPREFQRGGGERAIRYAIARCSLGALLVATTDRGICAISLGDDPDALERELVQRFASARVDADEQGLAALVKDVVAMVEQPSAAAPLPLDVRGTAFQRRVWRALSEIPAGETRTYAQIATALGAPKSVRAVASACAANTLAVAIPCHRVIQKSGKLAGYRWGIERKRALLSRERGDEG